MNFIMSKLLDEKLNTHGWTLSRANRWMRSQTLMDKLYQEQIVG
jgi:hypothetical protein